MLKEKEKQKQKDFVIASPWSPRDNGDHPDKQYFMLSDENRLLVLQSTNVVSKLLYSLY